jgi:hypothetical protein
MRKTSAATDGSALKAKSPHLKRSFMAVVAGRESIKLLADGRDLVLTHDNQFTSRMT